MEKSRLKILLVEDDEVHYEFLHRMLKDAQEWAPKLEWAKTYEEGEHLLRKESHDVYLIDYLLGSRTGLELLPLAIERHPDKPVIVLTAHGDKKIGALATSEGAADYLEKGGLTADALERSIRYAIKHKQAEQQLKIHARELEVIKNSLAQLNGAAESQDESGPSLKKGLSGLTVHNYEIKDRIGRGGMGEVYLGEHHRLKRKTALKFLGGDYDEESEAVKRFEIEALAISAINHPNIVTIYEVDIWQGIPYFAMEYVHGMSMKTLFGKQKVIPVDIAIHLLYQLAQGLLKAHESSIAHRDIKPANLMINRDGRLKVLDFGLAKLSEASRLTHSEHTLGTVHYIAPETFLGHQVDHRVDIWAAGVLFYQMLTGELPFGDQNIHRVMYAVVNTNPPALREKNEDLPAGLQSIIDRCLAKNPYDRYPSFSELLDELIVYTIEQMTSAGMPPELHVASYLNQLG